MSSRGGMRMVSARERRVVRAVLRELEDNVWSGIFRPGSWERGWLVQAIGEEALSEYLERLEPTPEAPWRLRLRAPRVPGDP